MLIPKKDRTTIFTYLFKEGVLVARKDVFHKHPTIPVRNLYVIKLMQSLESRSYVKHSYNWGYNYYYLTNAGIDFLRATLYLPETIVPATLTARKRVPQAGESTERRSFRRDGAEGEQRGGRGVRREGYFRSGEGAPAGRGRGPRTAAPVTAQ
jgi:small subunit ribosomal protein S10e